ncbi:hypothetical protein RvY_02582 [Ramazzottius varieornatus]|uniref:Uncharacterized protein n=1 Tax=Ramazzottius varieornatus TaxID=947166 RepID=A0A1D1US94_RAMVA|nr:hypothetical protein RvY_02582 [Ramazzottius varieornatus]
MSQNDAGCSSNHTIPRGIIREADGSGAVEMTPRWVREARRCTSECGRMSKEKLYMNISEDHHGYRLTA